MGLGLTMPLVMDAGLRTKSQWEYLKRTPGGGVSRNELAKFGCTPQLEAELLLDLPLQQQQPQQQQRIPNSWIAVEPVAQDVTPSTVAVRAIDPRSYSEQQEDYNEKKGSSSSGVPRLRTPAEIQKQTAPRLVVLRK